VSWQWQQKCFGSKVFSCISFVAAPQHPQGKKISKRSKWKGEKGIVAGKRLEINNSWDIYGRGFTIKEKLRDMTRKR
jgi:hypothetical protein